MLLRVICMRARFQSGLRRSGRRRWPCLDTQEPLDQPAIGVSLALLQQELDAALDSGADFVAEAASGAVLFASPAEARRVDRLAEPEVEPLGAGEGGEADPAHRRQHRPAGDTLDQLRDLPVDRVLVV